MRVDRCICHGVTFAELLRLARDRGLGLEELSELTGCGTGCGMCVPYIRAALRTGRAELPVLSPASLEWWEPPAGA